MPGRGGAARLPGGLASRLMRDLICSPTRTAALFCFCGAVAAVALGVTLAAWRYPSGFDWAYTVISRLASERRNPDGALWLSGGFLVGMLLLVPVTGYLARRGIQPGSPAPRSVFLLRLGVAAGILLGLEGLLRLDLSVLHRKGHEAVALLAFLGFYGGVLGLHIRGVRHQGQSVWPALLVVAPLVAVGLSQVALYFDQRDLGWVNTDWREMGVPVWFSFAFWQWLAVAFLVFGLAHLLLRGWGDHGSDLPSASDAPLGS